MKRLSGSTFLGIIFSVFIVGSCFAQTLLSESFENLNWSSRGWYDNTSHGLLATSGCYAGNCLQWSWASGATIPTNGAGVRRLFTPNDKVFIRFYLKIASNWQGNGLTYGPHMIQILSDQDAAYQGPAYSYLDSYFEINGSSPNPIFSIQDSALINTSHGTPPNNLVTVTENRAVAGCNGDLGDPGQPTCYLNGDWYNGRIWRASSVTLTKNVWHKFEYYLQMNTISNNAARADGVLKLWVDGAQALSFNNIVYRTAQQPAKKFAQLFLGPYMGGGSTVAQVMWIDELSIYGTNQYGSATDAPPVITPISPPSGTLSCPSSPVATTLSVATNKPATCKLNASDAAYAAMKYTFPSTGGTTSSVPLSLACGTTYTYFIRCADAAGNADTSSTVITIPVGTASPVDTTRPTVTAFGVPATSTSLTVPVTTFTAIDNVGVTGYCVTSANNSSACTWTGSAPASYTFTAQGSQTAYAWAKDAAGNLSTPLTAAVTIAPPNNAPPVISNVSPTGTQACTANPRNGTLSISTDKAATCKLNASDASYGAMKYTFATTGGTTHSVPLTWSCGVTYTYYARCADASGNANTSSKVITIPIAK